MQNTFETILESSKKDVNNDLYNIIQDYINVNFSNIENSEEYKKDILMDDEIKLDKFGFIITKDSKNTLNSLNGTFLKGSGIDRNELKNYDSLIEFTDHLDILRLVGQFDDEKMLKDKLDEFFSNISFSKYKQYFLTDVVSSLTTIDNVLSKLIFLLKIKEEDVKVKESILKLLYGEYSKLKDPHKYANMMKDNFLKECKFKGDKLAELYLLYKLFISVGMESEFTTLCTSVFLINKRYNNVKLIKKEYVWE